MRLGIISDIHGNLPALEATLAALDAARVDRLLCLGDIVGYGPWPNECCEVVRERKIVTIQGNHDLAAVQVGAELWFTFPAARCIIWTRERLSEENSKLLQRLPQVRQHEGVTLAHGAIDDPERYVYSWVDAEPSFRLMATKVGFIGHTHYQGWFAYDDERKLGQDDITPSGSDLSSDDGRRYIVNPGGVGQPRDGNPAAAYAIYDSQRELVQLKRVPYDPEPVVSRMLAEGLPESMAVRLREGH